MDRACPSRPFPSRSAYNASVLVGPNNEIINHSPAKELQSFGMHLPDIIQVDELREFLTSNNTVNPSCLWMKENGRAHTSRAASVSSTSATSHQLSRLHSGPSNPGRTTKYDLKSAVSTTCAHSTSCSGVRDEKGASGISRSESLEISDREAWR